MTNYNSPPPLPPPSPLPYAHAYPQMPEPKRPIIAWWGIFPVLLFVVVHLIFSWSQAKVKSATPGFSEGYAVGFLLGGIVFGLLISGLLAWAAYAIGRRSTLAGTITFTLLLLLITLSSLSSSIIKSISAARPIVRHRGHSSQAGGSENAGGDVADLRRA